MNGYCQTRRSQSSICKAVDLKQREAENNQAAIILLVEMSPSRVDVGFLSAAVIVAFPEWIVGRLSPVAQSPAASPPLRTRSGALS